MFKNLKISQKLILLFLSISVLPLLASGIATYYFTKAELEKKTIAALLAVAQSRAAHVNQSIQLRQEQAKEVAGAYLLRMLTEVGANDPKIVQGIQGDIDSTLSDLKRKPTSPYKYIDQSTDIDIIGVWDVYGNIIANTNRGLIGKRMPFEYLKNVAESGTYFRGFEKDPLTGNNYLIHLEEIRNWKSNLIVGAVSLKIKATILNDITTSTQGLGESGETYLVDKKYMMITESRFNKDSIFKVRVLTEGAQACFKGEKATSIYKSYRGDMVLGVQQYLPDQDWCLLAEIKADEAFAPVKDFRDRMVMMLGFLVFFVFIFAYLASRLFTRPILRLHAASQEVARGTYPDPVEVKSHDEIGGLTEAFNNMTKNLKDFTGQLEEKSRTLFKHLAVSTRQRKELKQVNEELDSFVYTASHDLRAPLRAISSFATFLEEDYSDKLDEEGKDYLDEIRKGAGKMSNLIDDLLQLSRISRIKNPFEDVNMKAMIEGVVDRIKFDIKEKKVDLSIQEDMPTVFCDKIKMQEVFLNLINNAIKFSSKNEKENPRVEIGFVDDDVNYKFFVKDNGIGIDPKHHAQVFGIFRRLHTDKEYEGTGAGLSIIKRVIDGHKGEIWIESEAGKGAAFFFTIPKTLKEEQITETEETDQPEEPNA